MKWIAVLAAALLLSACEKPGQHAYRADEVGVSKAVEFGTVINVREVDIIGKTQGAGVLGGGAAGFAAGNAIGGGTGNIVADVAGTLIGAAAGEVIEQKIRDSKGYEYVLSMQSGGIKTITQEKIDGDEMFKPGDKVMLQYCDAGEHNKKCKRGEEFQRLIKVAAFPDDVEKPKKKKKHKKKDDDDDGTH